MLYNDKLFNRKIVWKSRKKTNEKKREYYARKEYRKEWRKVGGCGTFVLESGGSAYVHGRIST